MALFFLQEKQGQEQFYFDLLKPDYNILKNAGSSIGFKHSEKTLDIFRNKGKASEETRKNLSLSAKGRVLTEADKKKISISRALRRERNFQLKRGLKYLQQLVY